MGRRALFLRKKGVVFLGRLDPKQHRQVMERLRALRVDPYPPDGKKLSGHPGCRSVDAGEYRICYRVEALLIVIVVVNRRNDGAAYRELRRAARRRIR